MTKKTKKQNNIISVVVIQIIIIFFATSLTLFTFGYSLPVGFVLLVLTRGLYTYDYKCSNCGSTAGKDSEYCYNCKEIF